MATAKNGQRARVKSKIKDLRSIRWVKPTCDVDGKREDRDVWEAIRLGLEIIVRAPRLTDRWIMRLDREGDQSFVMVTRLLRDWRHVRDQN